MTLRKVFALTFYVSVLVALISGSNSFSSPAAQEAEGPIQKAKLISPSHGWALAGGRLLWTDDSGLEWNDITQHWAPARNWTPYTSPTTIMPGRSFVNLAKAALRSSTSE